MEALEAAVILVEEAILEVMPQAIFMVEAVICVEVVTEAIMDILAEHTRITRNIPIIIVK